MSVPEKLGKYSVTRVLGKGAMGVVYEGLDPVIERRVAIKTIHSNLLAGDEGQQLLDRFKREAQAAGRLMHQNIVTIYEYGEDQGTPFIAMEFVEGKELKDHIRDETRFDLGKTVDIIAQTLEALAYVHEGGVVHRDMKPANIILLANGHVKVADFGIARLESSTMTQMGTVMGTPSYMSPEQFMGQRVDQRADLFSLGVILYEMLTGEKPFPGKAMTTIMQKVLNSEPENPTKFNLDLPKSFDALLQKALAKRPNQRFQSAKEFLVALRLAEKGEFPTGDAHSFEDAATLPFSASMDQEAETLIAPSAPVHDDRTKGSAGGTRVSPPPVYGDRTVSQPERIVPTTRPAAPLPSADVGRPVEAAPRGSKSLLLVAVGLGVLLVVVGVGWWFSTKPALPPRLDSQPVKQAAPSAVPPGLDSQPLAKPAAPSTVSPGGEPSVKETKDLKGSKGPAMGAKLMGKVNAVTDPPGAVILVNGEFMGVTPHVFDLPVGDYQIVLKKSGFNELEASMEVEANASLDMNVPL